YRAHHASGDVVDAAGRGGAPAAAGVIARRAGDPARRWRSAAGRDAVRWNGTGSARVVGGGAAGERAHVLNARVAAPVVAAAAVERAPLVHTGGGAIATDGCRTRGRGGTGHA